MNIRNVYITIRLKKWEEGQITTKMNSPGRWSEVTRVERIKK